MKRIIPFFIFCCTYIVVTAQLSLDVELRPRYEVAHGYKVLAGPDFDAAHYVSQRSRLKFSFKKGDFFGKLTLQDARVWGGANNFSLFESYLGYRFDKKNSIKAGRMSMQYDEGRLIAHRNWLQRGYFYDALVYSYDSEADSLKVDIGFSMNNDAENTNGNGYNYVSSSFKTFNFLYLKKQFDPQLWLSFTALAYGYMGENSSTLRMGSTFGPMLVYDSPKWTLKGEAYYQFGNNRAAKETSAYLWRAYAMYKVNAKTGFGISYDLASGNDLESDTDFSTENRAFSNLEGARLNFFGRANIFRSLENHFKGGGAKWLSVDWSQKWSQKWKTSLHYQYFDSHRAVSDGQGGLLDAHLGSEIDLVATYKFKKGITFKSSASLVLPSESFETMQGITPGESETSYFFWLACIFKINAYTSK